MKVGDNVRIIKQLCPTNPVGTILKIIDIKYRDKGLQWIGGTYNYILEGDGYYWKEHIELVK